MQTYRSIGAPPSSSRRQTQLAARRRHHPESVPTMPEDPQRTWVELARQYVCTYASTACMLRARAHACLAPYAVRDGRRLALFVSRACCPNFQRKTVVASAGTAPPAGRDCGGRVKPGMQLCKVARLAVRTQVRPGSGAGLAAAAGRAPRISKTPGCTTGIEAQTLAELRRPSPVLPKP
jgi:hypothetical protein